MEVEAVTAAVRTSWHAILDTEPFDPQRPLIDTGADSLRVMQFVLELEQTLGCKVSYDILSPQTTPSALVASLCQGEERRTSLPQIFFLSGLAGTDYQMVSHLRKSLMDNAVVTHARSPGLDQPLAMLRDMDATAAWIATNIAAEQPTGEIRLSGYSVGGIQAFEVARQLIAHGREVAFVCLFDAIPRRTIRRIVKDTLGQPSQLLGKLQNRLPRLERAQRQNDSQGVLVNLALRFGAYGLASRAARLSRSGNLVDNRNEAEIFMLWRWRLLAAKQWRPKPLGVKSLLVLTDDGVRFRAASFWQRWINELSIFVVPGSHDALSKTPVSDSLRLALLAHV